MKEEIQNTPTIFIPTTTMNNYCNDFIVKFKKTLPIFNLNIIRLKIAEKHNLLNLFSMKNSTLYKLKNISCLLTFLLLFVSILSAQEDARLWTSLDVEQDFGKTTVGMEGGLRFSDNFSMREENYANINADYKIISGLHACIGYRISADKEKNYYKYSHRFNLDISYKIDIKRFDLGVRSRIQSKYSQINSSETGQVPNIYNRNKILLSYNIKKNPISPFIAFEFYYKLNNPDKKYIDKLRYSAGIKYKVDKGINLKIYYMNEKEINKSQPKKLHIYSVSLSFNL